MGIVRVGYGEFEVFVVTTNGAKIDKFGESGKSRRRIAKTKGCKSFDLLINTWCQIGEV